jgi:hypothetical protein
VDIGRVEATPKPPLLRKSLAPLELRGIPNESTRRLRRTGTALLGIPQLPTRVDTAEQERRRDTHSCTALAPALRHIRGAIVPPILKLATAPRPARTNRNTVVECAQ